LAEHRRERGIRGPGAEKDADHQRRAVRGLVDEMHLHGEALLVHLVLRRRMKVELHEPIDPVANANLAVASCHVRPHGGFLVR